MQLYDGGPVNTVSWQSGSQVNRCPQRLYATRCGDYMDGSFYVMTNDVFQKLLVF